MVFPSAEYMATARVAVKAVNRSFVGSKPVWLDAMRSKEENAPNRSVHRIYDYLQFLESAKPEADRVEVTKVLDKGLKAVKAGQVTLYEYRFGRGIWTGYANERYSEAELSEGMEYAFSTWS